MPFMTIPGLKGKVYMPQPAQGGIKKNPCPDCFSCQHCSAVRCGACLSRHTCRRPSLELRGGTETTKKNC